MNKTLLPMLLVIVFALSGCSLANDFINDKKVEINGVVQEEKNKIIENAKTKLDNVANGAVVNLSNKKLTKVPMTIFDQTNIETLDVSNNQLTGLPNELANLKNLKTMNLSGNNYSQQDLDYIKQRLPNTNFILQ